RLPWDLLDGICQQCHLEGKRRVLKRGRDFFDYRPGLPWQMIWTVFVPTEQAKDENFVSSVEQLRASRCYQGTKGEMGCRSCHPAHRLPEPEKRIDYYRGQCQACHQDRPCTLVDEKRQASGDNCIACHMPRFGSSDIPHTAVTDHRIPRDPSAPPAKQLPSIIEGFSMRPYLALPVAFEEQEADRARALVMIEEGQQRD